MFRFYGCISIASGKAGLSGGRAGGNFHRPPDVLTYIDKPTLENQVGRNIFYIIGVIVVVIAVLSLVGLR
ncbi:hypothetical protein N825_18650 [Skermanella stibiiresistens SB22]|uniref:Uncharacterized protein n=1 Tax=Skermanella stibiiresistens SB22 TaxID=1385369 RepID=W9HC59_9PROT|nr:hypothetical protein N825_18650 [Skermanella stibiiresistens SB22]